ARFDKIDTKHQGFIDKDELAAYVGPARAPLADRIMKRRDTNHDGKITKDEFEKPLRKRFALLDLNDDGKVTREEAELAGPASMLGAHHRDGE
ncbi:EF-hand domain-containing protein, partial [Acinetobacter baumannii]